MTLIIHSLVFLMFLLMIQPTRLRRLQRIVDMIPTGSIVADIGADHGLLSASLAHSSLRVYAIERSEVAARNGVISLVQEKQLQDKVHILIGDGLQPLIHSKVDFVDTAIMAGIGTNSILNILENGTSESLRTLGLSLFFFFALNCSQFISHFVYPRHYAARSSAIPTKYYETC